MTTAALLTGTVALAALITLLWALRGRRVGSHPHCTRCEFNLHGLPADAATCPECGNDLTRHGAATWGERRRRPYVAAPALAILAMAGLLTALTIWSQTSSATFYAYAPSEYLLWTLNAPGARTELHDRLQQGELSASQTGRLVDHALDQQGDLNKPWDETWGAIIEQAHAAGHVSQGQIERYARQAMASVSLRFTVRPEVQQGRTPAGYIERSGDPRIGPNTTINATVRLTELQINGQPIELHRRLRHEASEFELRQRGHSGSMSHLPLEAASQSIGTSSLEAQVEMEFTLSLAASPVTQHPLSTPRSRLTATTRVRENPTGTYLRDELPPDEQQGRAGVWIEDDPRNPGSRRLMVGLIQQDHQPPRYKLFVRIHNELHEFDRIMNGNSRSWGGDHATYGGSVARLLQDRPDLIANPRIDILVRPDIDAAESYVTPPPTWLGEWIFEDVPLDAEPLTPPPQLYNATSLPSLVPPRVRLLTFEEADGPPSPHRDATPDH